MAKSAIGALALLVGLAGAQGASRVSAQQIQAGPVTLDLTGRAQVQFSTTSVRDTDLPADEGVPATAFETRRIRFGTDFAFEDWIAGAIEADFVGGTATLTNGFVDLSLAESLVVRAGQFKKPFGLFELTSSTKILTIERAARLRGLEAYLGAVPSETQTLLVGGRYVGRDIGVEAFGAVGPVTYAAGVFNGSGANARETLDSKAVAGRLGVAVSDGLVVGAAASRQPLVGTAWALDAELGAFREPGLHVMAEVMTGDNASLAAGGTVPTMVGAQAAAGWFAPRAGRVEGIEPLVRVSWADPDTDLAGDHGLLLTPGLNLYFTGRNRLMLNGDLYLPAQDGRGARYGLVAQLQVYF